MAAARTLFGGAAGWVAGLTLAAHPLAFLYDRLALSDVFLSAALTAVAWASIRVGQTGGAGPVVALGVAVALAVYAKIAAILFLPALLLAALVADRAGAAPRLLAGGALGAALAAPMLVTFFRNAGEILTHHVNVGDDREVALAATRALADWVLVYWTPGLLAGFGVAMILLRDRRAAFLAGATVLPLAGFALLSSPWSARYILPLAPLTALAIAGGFSAVWGAGSARARAAALAGLTATLLPAVRLDVAMARDLPSVPLPSDERLQLVTGWPAGYGLPEVAEAVRSATTGTATLYIEAAGPRTPSTSLPILLAARRAHGLDLRPRDLALPAVRAEILASADGGPTFVVAAARSDGGDWKADAPFTAESIVRVSRPGGEWAATLFRILPLPPAETSR